MIKNSESAARPLGRRRLLVGAGTAALAAGIVGTVGTVGTVGAVGAEPASAAVPTPHGDGTTGGGESTLVAHPNSSPIVTTIASPPISGYTYRTVCMYDFTPFDPNAKLTWGGYGTYSAGTASSVRATMEIPAGALVRDIEYYLYNNTGSNFYPDLYLYAPGYGSISPVGGSVPVPSGGGIVAARAVVGQQGPYPVGARLVVSINTPNTGLVQINGARVGFSQGAAQMGLLPEPVRVYDSRTGGGQIGRLVTRRITLPANLVPAGASGVIINLTAVNGAGAGYLKIASAAAGLPAASAINFGVGEAVANALVVAISANRQLNITASIPVDVIVDLTGVIA